MIDDEYPSMFGSGFGGLNQPKSNEKKDLDVEFELSLEDIYTGGMKTLVYKRRVLNQDCRTTELREKSIEIDIPRGVPDGIKLRYKGYGHDCPGEKTCIYC